MAYGTLKCDNIVFDNGGVDKSITVSGLFYSTSGALTVTGAISGGSVTAPTATFTTLTGITTAGTTATFTSGSFTSLTGVTTTVTSGIFGLGTAAAPSITLSGDLNTGIYSPGADQLAITTSGTGRMFVDGSGNVGFGTAFPGFFIDVNTSAANEVAAGFRTSATGAAISFRDATTTSTARPQVGAIGNDFVVKVGNTPQERLRITSAGLVGIGTTPDTILHAAVSQAGSAAINIFKAQATNTTDNVTTRLDLSAEPALGTASVVRLSAITGNAADSSNMAFNVRNAGTSTEALRISSVGTTTLTSAASTAPFIAKISSTEVARIDSSGRLLVGTSNAGSSITKTIELANAGTNASQPAYQVYSYPGASDINCGYFQFYKSRGATVGTNTIVASNDVLGQMYWYGANGTGYDIAASIKAEVDGTPGASNDMPGRLVFSTTADGAASPTERLRITNDGVQCYNQPTPATYAAAATLTVADLKTAIITYTGAAATLTLPTGTLTESGFANIYTNMTFEWSVINTGSGLCTIGAGTAHTITGGATIAAGASGRFASRRTAANTFISYRLS